MEKIGIFCSASEEIDPEFFEATRRLGAWMGKERKTLVYGGANLGLMECIARATKECGGKLVGVVPAILEENGRASSLPDRIIPTRNLSDRKDCILEESDILVALPGGVGTLDEVFHVIAAASIGYHHKKVIFYNVAGFYNSLLAVLEEMKQKNFMRHPLCNYYAVANTFSELINLLKQPNLTDNND
ncbi:TIGR00730 family Rossman fold protein [uncultured Bacteroides sp.]|uniref:LOG family protein n=1 Tax=uncultured Bacteroides sp. TaxID=162156 RepID=UPI002AA62CC5|nr:TIGR00730 family Rossman fold protein [uncultured Bacteroides sp.]